MLVRVGYVFILISLIVLFVFFASYQVETPKYSLLLVGLALIFLGIYMVIKNRKQPEADERFRMFRKMRSKKKKDGE